MDGLQIMNRLVGLIPKERIFAPKCGNGCFEKLNISPFRSQFKITGNGEHPLGSHIADTPLRAWAYL